MNFNQYVAAKVGLPICQHLCKKMGGQIKVNSVKDKGSKFWFVLPVTRPQSSYRRTDTRQQVEAIGTLGTAGHESPLTENNVFKSSKGINALNNEDQSPTNNFKGTPFNEESYESKDIEIEDIYESEDCQMGIPQGVAIQNHLINENILWSFFPGGKIVEGELSSGDEEQKNHQDNNNGEQEYNLNSKRFREIRIKQGNKQFSFTQEDANRMNRIAGINLIR